MLGRFLPLACVSIVVDALRRGIPLGRLRRRPVLDLPGPQRTGPREACEEQCNRG